MPGKVSCFIIDNHFEVPEISLVVLRNVLESEEVVLFVILLELSKSLETEVEVLNDLASILLTTSMDMKAAQIITKMDYALVYEDIGVSGLSEHSI